MHQLLQLRSTVQAASGHPCTVETFLGGGGQGEVYRALLDGNKELTADQQKQFDALKAEITRLEADEQRAWSDRIGAAVQAHHAALAGDECFAYTGRQQGEAQAFHPRHRYQYRGGVVGQGHIEFRAHRLLFQ